MPVNIATGSVRLEFDDVAIPGKIRLVWNRLYTTQLLENPGATALGRGWTSKYFATLAKTAEGFQYRSPEGDLIVFADPGQTVERGAVIRQLGTFQELFRLDRRYVVQSWDVETGEIQRYCFTANQAGPLLRLTSLEDLTGQAVDLNWDLQGRLVEIRQRLEKRALLLDYSVSGLITSIALNTPNGEQHHLVRYEYDLKGGLIAVYDAAKYADRYEYDTQGRVHREIVKDGGIFYYRYDEKGRCMKTSGLNRYAEKRLRYFDAIGFTEVTDSYGAIYRYQYLPSGQMLREIDPLGNEKKTEYDELGRVIAKIDAMGGKTLYTYDELGNRASLTNALGDTTSFTYNDQHLPLSMTDALGHIWRRAYDNANRLIATLDPLGHRWQVGYDQEGNIKEITNPLGAKKYQKYEQGILKAVTDWLGNITYFQLDGFGRVAQRKGALGELTRFSYDLLGNPVEVVLPDGAKLCLVYDNVGNLIKFVNANGEITRACYGSCRRLLERIDPAGSVVRYIWGSEPGRLERVINEKGDSYTFFRDIAGSIICEQSFDGSKRNFRYDTGGYAVAYINANNETILIQRDSLHRIIGQTLPDGERIIYSFDPNGNLLSAVNADIQISFVRDPLGRIVKEIQGEQWVESHYDALGNLIHTTTSLGHTVDFEVDDIGFLCKLRTLGNQSLEFKRNVYGQETLRQMPGDIVMKQRYDNLGRLVEQGVGSGRLESGGMSVIYENNNIIHRNYSYDPNSSLTSIVDDRWGRTDYVYDPAERLLQAIQETGSREAFSYDVAGNITEKLYQSKDYCSNERLIYGAGNRLMEKGKTLYEYDAEGRRIMKVEASDGDISKIWLYEWNALGRLKSVTRPNGDVRQYKYDAFARLVEKTGPDNCEKFLWDKDVIIQHSTGTAPISTWVYDVYSFAPLATIQNACVYSVITDQAGTPRELVDGNGKITWAISLDAWGGELSKYSSNSGRVICPIRFQGQWHDCDIQLQYNRHRYFDSSAGQFISQDPLGLISGVNFYNFSPNAISWIDPLGLSETWYRTMSDRDYNKLVETGVMPASNKETMISPTQSYAEQYDGVTVKLIVKDGTTDALLNIGVRNNGPLVQEHYGDLPEVSSVKNWKENNAFFKEENGQINIGLGKGKALDTFNENLEEFEKVEKPCG